MSDGFKLTLRPFKGRKKRKVWSKTRKNICRQKEDRLKQIGDHSTIKSMARSIFRH